MGVLGVSLVSRLVEQASSCGSSHIRKGRYSAVDAAMDATFPPKLGSFKITCSMPLEAKDSQPLLPNNVSVSSMYLDLCTIHLAFTEGPLSPTLMIITQDLVYTEVEAMEICDLYLTLSPLEDYSNAVVVQKDAEGWYVRVAYRASGSRTNVHGDGSRYSTEELLAYLSGMEGMDGCLAIAHSEPDGEAVKILSSLHVSSWSIGSDPSCYPALSLRHETEHCMLLPVYTFGGSAYTRALLPGGPINAVYPQAPRYLGDISFYNTRVRGAQMRSGRCWDCECIYQLALRLEADQLRADPDGYDPVMEKPPEPLVVEVASDLDLGL